MHVRATPLELDTIEKIYVADVEYQYRTIFTSFSNSQT